MTCLMRGRTARFRSCVACFVFAAAHVGCSKPSESTDARRSPRPPPSATVTIPAALHLDVEIDGAPAAPIDATRLTATRPDYSDDEHRAWRVSTLVGPAAARPGAVVSATGAGGVSLEMPAPSASSEPAPTLSLNRRGDVVVGLVAPDDPFPEYHGRGGRLNRPGDRLPRLLSPTALRVFLAGDGGH
jgi:hypothetical protein